MTGVEKIQNEIVEELSLFSNWIEKYEYLIELGKDEINFDKKFMKDEFLINGCQSKVWLYAKQNNSKITFHAYSDAIMTKGIIALLVKVFSNQSPDDIINSKLDFIDKIGLKSHLSATRANGLMSMIKQIKIYAIGFKEKNG
mgnify:FL=1